MLQQAGLASGIGLALFLPFAWYFALPLALFGGVVLAGVTFGNLAGIAFELRRRRRENGG